MADIELRLGSDVLVVQGAMGTMFEAAGFGGPGETCYPFLNLTEPETVEELHRRYLAAGADCAVTNTFLATSSRLAPYGLLGIGEQINREGVRLARGVGFQHVLAAVGPCGVEVEPGSGLAALAASEAPDGAAYPPEACAPGYGAAVEQYAEQIAALACEGPDAVLLETFTDLDDALAAVDAARRVCDLPVMACLSFVHGPEGGALSPDPAEAARALVRAGAAAVGCNCTDVDDAVAAVEAMRSAVDAAIVARPSAGEPVCQPDGSPTWPVGPDGFADAAVRLVRAGARVVGSCCGSTPACTGAIFAAVGGLQGSEG